MAPRALQFCSFRSLGIVDDGPYLLQSPNFASLQEKCCSWSSDLRLLSPIFSSVGGVAFLIESLSPMGLLPVGGVLETVGASFLLLGLRKNFLFWASKDHFA